MPKRKPNTLNCALYVLEEHDRDGAFYHLNICIVRTIEADKVRNITYSGYDEDRLDGFADLMIRSQGCGTDTPRQLYGFEVLYHNCYAANHARVTVMAQTLSALHKKLDQIEQLRGRAADYAEFVGRVAEALSITRMVIKTTRNPGWAHDDQRHRVLSMGDGVEHVRRLVRDWVKAGEPKEVISDCA